MCWVGTLQHTPITKHRRTPIHEQCFLCQLIPPPIFSSSGGSSRDCSPTSTNTTRRTSNTIQCVQRTLRYRSSNERRGVKVPGSPAKPIHSIHTPSESSRYNPNTTLPARTQDEKTYRILKHTTTIHHYPSNGFPSHFISQPHPPIHPPIDTSTNNHNAINESQKSNPRNHPSTV